MTDDVLTPEEREKIALLPSQERNRLARDLAEAVGTVEAQKAALEQLRRQIETERVKLEELPCQTFTAAAPHLRRPFTPAAVKFKVQAATPKDEPENALIVCYIDARLVVERLNMVIPGDWHDEYAPVGNGAGLACRLTVGGITRLDVGDGYKGKGLYSDALKRAAVKFGVGVSLYATPKTWLKLGNGDVKRVNTREGVTLQLTDAGEQRCRATYSAWLDRTGTPSFGEPLDHGDVLGAAGDAELEAEALAAQAEQPQASPQRQQQQRPPSQPRQQQAPAQAPPQQPPAEDWQAKLDALLGDPETVVGRKKAEAVRGMTELGAKPEQQWRELNAAGNDETALNNLIERVNAAVDVAAADAGQKPGEETDNGTE